MQISFDNTYIQLPERFFQKVLPSPVAIPKLIKFNHCLAKELGFQFSSDDNLAEFFSGNKIFNGSEPIAQAYAGHQFGHFVPQLGDGRAVLLGEVIDINHNRKDIQLKGSGQTAFSRRGDGRAWLGPVLREYLVSEAMHGLGVPTTRALAAVSTGENIYREQGALPGAIITRIASSHIRVGTFEYFFARKDFEALDILLNYVIDRHYPELKNSENQALDFLYALAKRQAELIIKWLSLGFVHGVMNTDNTSISGETIDYGPSAFMDIYDPDTVFSSIDHQGRYAYQNQVNIALWNISCLATTLLHLIDKDEKLAIQKCNEVFACYKNYFDENYKKTFLNKIGVFEIKEGDFDLVQDLLEMMFRLKADFTLSFRYLAKVLEDDKQSFLNLFDNYQTNQGIIDAWLDRWQQKLAVQSLSIQEIINRMNSINPAYIPRNHLVEEMISKAHLQNDFSMFEDLLECFQNPFFEQEKFTYFMQGSIQKINNYVTFCGT